MPVEIVADDLEQALQIAFHRDEQAEVELAVLHKVDAPALRLKAFRSHQGIGHRLFKLAGAQRHDVLAVLREDRAEHLVEQQRDRLADLFIHRLFAGVELHAEDLLAAIASGRNAVEFHLSAGLKVLIALHLPVARRFNAQVGKLAGDAHSAHAAAGTHLLRVLDAVDAVGPELAVEAASCDMLRRAAQHHAPVRRHAQHLVILALKGKELSGQIALEDMPHQLAAEIFLLAVFLLGNIARIFQVAEQHIAERTVDDLHKIIDLARAYRILPDGLNRFALTEHIFAAAALKNEKLLAVFIRFCLTDPAQQVPCLRHRILAADADQLQLVGKLSFGDVAQAHAQEQPQRHVARRACIIRHDRRDRLRIGIEQPLVLRHIVVQQILRRDDVDKALSRCASCKLALDLEHIAALVLNDKVAVLPHRLVPHIVGYGKAAVHLVLIGGKIGIAQQIIVILPRDPVHILHRKRLATVPDGLFHLIFQRHKGKLRANAQIMRDIGQQTVLQVLAVRLPAHIGAGPLVPVRCADLRDIGHQQVRKRVHKAVAVAVGRAVGHVFFPAAADNGVQPHLRGRQQARRLDQHDHAHIEEEFLVLRMEVKLMYAGARHDAHVKLLFAVRQHADVPHPRNIRHGAQAAVEPRFDILLHAVPAENDQHLSVPEQIAVHCIERIGDQVVIERVVEQHALAPGKVQPRSQIARIHLQPCALLLIHISIVGVGNGVARLHSPRKTAVFLFVKQRGPHGRVFGSELIRKKLAQHAAQRRKVAEALRLFALGRDILLQLARDQPVEEKVQLAQHDHAEHRVEKRCHPLVKVELDRNAPHHSGNAGRRQKQRLQERSALRAVLLQQPCAAEGIVFVAQLSCLVRKPARLADRAQQWKAHQLQDDMTDEEQHIEYIEYDQLDAHIQKRRHQRRKHRHILHQLRYRKQQPAHLFIQVVHQEHRRRAVDEREYRQQELYAAVSAPDVRLAVDPQEECERQIGEQRFEERYQKFSHTAPPI